MIASRKKLTLVSISFRGQRFSFFCHLPIDPDGKVRADYQKLAGMIGVQRGQTFTLS